jgi:hypothetical protein
LERIKYITNKELLIEIDRSKRSYSSFLEPKYARYDLIVHDIKLITPELVDSTLQKRLELVAKQGPAVWGTALADGIGTEDIVFRVMTNEHIPHDPNRKRRLKVPGDEGQAKTPFAPFKHYIMVDGELKEVGRSHWKGGLVNGQFALEGKISNRLAVMFMLLVDRYSKRGNFRSYTYNDEMRGQALLQLSQTGLQFDESKSDNPFAFYTQVVKHSFTRILNVERKNQHIRDDLLIIGGVQPSYNRQIDHEIEQRFGHEQTINVPNDNHLISASKPVETPKRRGRRPKTQTPPPPDDLITY